MLKMSMELKKNATNELKVHVILWCIAAFMLFIGIMNLHGSIVLRDYRCLDGEIVDLEETQVLQKQGFVTRYNYTIVWYDDDIRYKKSMHEAIERPDKSLTKVWANSDNTDVSLGDSSSAKNSAYIYLSVAIITFILGMVFAPRQNEKRRMSIDKMESMYYQAVITAFLMAFADLYMIYLYCSTNSRHIYVTPVLWDIAGGFTVILVISIVIIVKLKKRLK